MNILVINGYSNAGKSTFSRWLANRCNADLFNNDEGDIEKCGLREFWHEVENYNSAKLIGLLSVRDKPIILDWAYPPYSHCLRMVRALMAVDIPVWWFDADAIQARESYARRGNQTLELRSFDNQSNMIEACRSEILPLYGDRFLCTLDASGKRMSCEQILQRIRGIDALPWLPVLNNDPPDSRATVNT